MGHTNFPSQRRIMVDEVRLTLSGLVPTGRVAIIMDTPSAEKSVIANCETAGTSMEFMLPKETFGKELTIRHRAVGWIGAQNRITVHGHPGEHIGVRFVMRADNVFTPPPIELPTVLTYDPTAPGSQPVPTNPPAGFVQPPPSAATYTPPPEKKEEPAPAPPAWDKPRRRRAWSKR